MSDICNCTRCGKPLDDFRIDIQFHVRVDRLREDTVWEYIPNLDNTSREVLCYDCFDKFTAALGTLNMKYNPETAPVAPPVDPEDGIVYDEQAR